MQPFQTNYVSGNLAHSISVFRWNIKERSELRSSKICNLISFEVFSSLLTKRYISFFKSNHLGLALNLLETIKKQRVTIVKRTAFHRFALIMDRGPGFTRN